MVMTTPTDFWNDSCSLDEIQYAIENGGTGATTNPIIVGEVLKKDAAIWDERLNEIIRENPNTDEVDIAWILIRRNGNEGSRIIIPRF